ncbi:MAG: ABC transporter permease [Beijerinckiaceae bacterium]
MNSAIHLLLGRAISAAPTLLIVACGVFILLSLAPGDAVDAYLAETGGDAGYAAELRRSLGLGGSLFDRLLAFLGSLLTLDLGRSAIFARPVLAVVLERLPNTLLLMATTTMFAAGAGALIGILAGARPGSWRDRSLTTAALILLAVPNFWLGLLLIVGFAVSLPWLPVGGLRTLGADGGGGILDTAKHLVLPTIALGSGYLAIYMRTLRAGMAEAWQADHVRSARARGVPESRVLARAVIRPALVPTAVIAGQNIGTLVGGSVVVETVFAIPGMGRLAYEAVTGRDTPLLIGVVMASTVLVILINLAVDLLLLKLDPRIGTASS